jgi:hypothetical protein
MGAGLASGESVFELIFDIASATSYAGSGTVQAEVDGTLS